jgi:hypothetical protein
MKSLCYFVLVVLILHITHSNSMYLKNRYSKIKINTPLLTLSSSKKQNFKFVLDYSEETLSNFMILDFILFNNVDKTNHNKDNVNDNLTCRPLYPNIACSPMEFEKIKSYKNFLSVMNGKECGDILSDLLCLSKCGNGVKEDFIKYNQSIDQNILSISFSTCFNIFQKCNKDKTLHDVDFENFCEKKVNLPMKIKIKVSKSDSFIYLPVEGIREYILNKNSTKLDINYKSLSLMRENIQSAFVYTYSKFFEIFESPIGKINSPINLENLIKGSLENHLYIISKIIYPTFTYSENKVQAKMLKILRYLVEFLKFEKSLRKNTKQSIDDLTKEEIVRIFIYFSDKLSQLVSIVDGDTNYKLKLTISNQLIFNEDFQSLLFAHFYTKDFSFSEIVNFIHNENKLLSEFKSHMSNSFNFIWYSIRDKALASMKTLRNFNLSFKKSKFEEIEEMEKNVISTFEEIYKNKTDNVILKKIKEYYKDTDIEELKSIDIKIKNDLVETIAKNLTNLNLTSENVNENKIKSEINLNHSNLNLVSAALNNNLLHDDKEDENNFEILKIVNNHHNIQKINFTSVKNLTQKNINNTHLLTHSHLPIHINNTLNHSHIHKHNFTKNKSPQIIHNTNTINTLHHNKTIQVNKYNIHKKKHNKTIKLNSNKTHTHKNSNKTHHKKKHNKTKETKILNNTPQIDYDADDKTPNFTIYTSKLNITKKPHFYNATELYSTLYSNYSEDNIIRIPYQYNITEYHSELNSDDNLIVKPHLYNSTDLNLTLISDAEDDNIIRKPYLYNITEIGSTLNSNYNEDNIIRKQHLYNATDLNLTLYSEAEDDNIIRRPHLFKGKNISSTLYSNAKIKKMKKNKTKKEIRDLYSDAPKNLNSTLISDEYSEVIKKTIDFLNVTKSNITLNQTESLHHLNLTEVKKSNSTKLKEKETHIITKTPTNLLNLTRTKTNKTIKVLPALNSNKTLPQSGQHANHTQISHHVNFTKINSTLYSDPNNNLTDIQIKIDSLLSSNKTNNNLLKDKLIDSKNKNQSLSNDSENTLNLAESLMNNMTLEEDEEKILTLPMSLFHNETLEVNNKTSEINNKTNINFTKLINLTKFSNDTLNSDGYSLIKNSIFSDGVFYKEKNKTQGQLNVSKEINHTYNYTNGTISFKNDSLMHGTKLLKKHKKINETKILKKPQVNAKPIPSSHQPTNNTEIKHIEPQPIKVKQVDMAKNLQLERSKTNNSLEISKLKESDPTHISEDMLKASTFSLITYDISIIGEVVFYYMAILFLLLTYCIMIKILINKCYEYFVFHNYKLSAKNYSYLFLNITICLLINVTIGIVLYKDLLIILLFAVDSELIAAAITFHFQHGKVFGPLGFSLFGILVSIKIITVINPLLKILCIFITALVFFFFGALVGVNKYIEYEKVKTNERMRRPVQRMTTITEESILSR